MNATPGKAFLKYTLMPQIIPRFRELFASGFRQVPYFIALVYQTVRLLPDGHPYLDPRNAGRYGVRHVIAEAANNLVFSRKNIDQIILFFMILTGLVLVALQIGLLVFGVIAQPALAADFGKLFQEKLLNPFYISKEAASQDLAYMMLDMVFGIPGIFNSCISTYSAGASALASTGISAGGISLSSGLLQTTNIASGATCLDMNGQPIVNSAGTWILAHLGFPFPVHYGLHALFQFYSMGLLIVAMLITIYFIGTVVAETAQTGTPFGKRFNKVWAPVRLVVAIGLLVPVGSGLNGAQYIVLYAAKIGSAFATNGWNLFIDALSEAEDQNFKAQANKIINDPLSIIKNDNTASAEATPAPSQALVVVPKVPEMSELLQFLYTARVCAEAQWVRYNTDIQLYMVKDTFGAAEKAVALKSPNSYSDTWDTRKIAQPLNAGSLTKYDSLIAFADGHRQVTLRFGVQDEKNYAHFRGFVKPICGEMVFNLTDPLALSKDYSEEMSGTEVMQRAYWALLQYTWFDLLYRDPETKNPYALNTIFTAVLGNAPGYPLPDAGFARRILAFYKGFLSCALEDPKCTDKDSIKLLPITPSDIGIQKGAAAAQSNDAGWKFDAVLRSKGWGGAGIWYNKIAEINGTLITAVTNVPAVVQWPDIMVEIYNQKKAKNQTMTPATRFEPEIAGRENSIEFKIAKDKQIAQALWAGYKYWQTGVTSTTHTQASGNDFIDMINALFGTEGLYNLRANQGAHPLAQLVGVGRSLVQAAVNNMTVLVVGGVLSARLGAQTVGNISIDIGMAISTIALTLGFILFYVVPFLPFVYFFFALGGWVKGIFEAMVGAPLWALAHIRIDGNGLPGSAAMNGYYLIFEIFLRPILCVVGLIAGVSIFAALVDVLHSVWDIVVANVGGFDAETLADQQSSIINNVVQKTGVDLGGKSVEDFLRSPIDEFFFTIMYTVIVYMMGMSSFKLIDLIPNNIMRWMGSNISTFNDSSENPAQNLMGRTYTGSQQAIGQIGGAVGTIGKEAAGLKGG